MTVTIRDDTLNPHLAKVLAALADGLQRWHGVALLFHDVPLGSTLGLAEVEHPVPFDLAFTDNGPFWPAVFLKVNRL